MASKLNPKTGKRKKTGGRAAGTPNKATAAREKEIAASGVTPLQYMLGIMRDEAQPKERRDDMARAAAPYCHPRMNTVDHSGSIELGRMEDELDRLEGKVVVVV